MHEHNGPLSAQRYGNGIFLRIVLVLLAFELCVEQENLVASATAQTAAPTIVTASELQLTPGTDTPWHIVIKNKELIPDRTVLIVRGLPPEMRLSEGRAFGTGIWLVPLAQLPNLRISIPADVGRGATLNVSLATLDGKTLAQHQLNAVIARSETQSATSSITTATAGAVPRLSPRQREAALFLVQKGNNELKLGNLFTARQCFERAADSGLPEGAMALGATYDPEELARIDGFVTVRPDAGLARKWYEKALVLGDQSAAARIQRLSQR